jgi:GTPase SAR1 family protein
MIDILKRRVLSLKDGYRQNIAVLGHSYVGKSTLLQHFVTDLDDKDVVPIYLDLDNKDFQYFFVKFIGSLLYRFCKQRELSLHDDIDKLIESASSAIPHTVEVIKAIRHDLEMGKRSDCFLGLLTLPEIFCNETETYCVLILDEFQGIEDLAIPDAFQKLGKKIMTQKRCFYIVSSSNITLAHKILGEKLSLLFGNFEVLNLEPFDTKTSQNFIQCYLEGLRIGIELQQFIADFCGGYPLYLNLICREMRNLAYVHRQDEIYLPLLTQAVENTIFDRWGVISRHFDLLINELCSGKDNRVIGNLLMSIANGSNKFEDIMAETGLTKGQLNQRLNRLIEIGVILRNINFYCFKDRLLKHWIKYVHQKRIKDVELAPDRQRKQFREDFQATVSNFKVSARMDFSSRMVELINCFENEAFHLNGRKYKLPALANITPMKIRSENGPAIDVIEAKTDDASWHIIMKKENFAENDLNNVLSKIKPGRKQDKGLIISLNGLDQNARVKALQERFWIWDSSEVNTLLTLFDKPFIL